jgi:hypothetical protein
MIRLIVEWDGENGRIIRDPSNVNDVEVKRIMIGALKPIVDAIRRREAERIVLEQLFRIARH